jgi:hypothetical protein
MSRFRSTSAARARTHARKRPLGSRPRLGCTALCTRGLEGCDAVCRRPSTRGGADSDGMFASEALSRYSPDMNELIAESVTEAVLNSAAQPGGPFPKQVAAGRPPPVNLARDVQQGAGGKVQGGDGGSEALADRELKIFNDAGYTIKLHTPDYFLGCNVEPGPTHHLSSTSPCKLT